MAAIILIPIVWLVTLIWIRILLELVIIIFRIGEDVRRISLSSVLTGQGQAVSPASGEQLSGNGVTPTGAAYKHHVPHRVSETRGIEPTCRSYGAAQSLSASQEDSPKRELPAAGWYQDPEHEGYARFWSGESRTDQRRQMNSFAGR